MAVLKSAYTCARNSFNRQEENSGVHEREQWQDNKHLKQDDAFNRTWCSVLSIDKLVTWQHLLTERTGGHVVLKASSLVDKS